MKETVRVISLVVTLFFAAQAARADPASGEAKACFPECRTGYTCHEGACVSLCNPACDDGEVCTAAGECVPDSRRSVEAGITKRGAPSGGVGWAPTASFLGYLSAGVVAGLGTTAVVIDKQAVSIPMGSAALLDLIVTAPIVEAGAKSARQGTGATGSHGLRVAGWIGYALAAANGASEIGQALAGVDVPQAESIPTVALGTFALVAFAYDATLSAQQASSSQASQETARRIPEAPALSWMPQLSAWSSRDRGTVETIGLAGTF